MAKAEDGKASPRGWLLKTEPDSYSFKDLEREGKTVWDGVTNNLALRNIRNIKKGDQLLIYHTGNEKAVAGLAEAVSPAYPDPKANDPKLVVFDIKPKKRAANAVTLADIKQIHEMAGSDLVRLPRLSVVPLTEKEWQRITKLAGL
ncbi:MAG TPA: EVE domain-containing protein [Blastocatellia bacterium]|nr:EVE domain-containing protein [Blastocatellia bacterium]